MPKHSRRALVVPLQPILLTRQLEQVRSAEMRLHKIQADIHQRHGPDSDWFLCTHELCVHARETLQEILHVSHFPNDFHLRDSLGRFTDTLERTDD